MVAQSPAYAMQNAQHSAALFRLASFSPWRDQSGIVGPTDFAVTAQASPNMSVQVGAGRAWLKGTQLASVSGGTWSTQGGYYGYNDAPVSLTVAAADPTNPRIDAVVAYATDAFYSGASNTFVLAVITGTPAASPAAPAVPSNGLLLGTLAVSANATSISNGNIGAASGLLAITRGGIVPVLSTDVVAGTYVGQYRDHPTLGAQRWGADGTWGPVDLGRPFAMITGTNAALNLTGSSAEITGLTATVKNTGMDVTSKPGAIRAVRAGWYLCSATLAYIIPSGTGRRQAGIGVNDAAAGGNTVSGHYATAANGLNATSAAVPIALNAGDWINPWANYDSAVAPRIDLTGSFLQATYMGPL